MFLLKHFSNHSVHVGNSVCRWNPNTCFFLLGLRDGLHIIDLEQSVLMIKRALMFLKHLMLKRGYLFLLNSPLYKTTSNYYRVIPSYSFEKSFKLSNLLIPQAIFIFHPNSQQVLIKEAFKFQIPVIALCDSDNDPHGINYPIPANHNNQYSIKLFFDLIRQVLKDVKKYELSRTN